VASLSWTATTWYKLAAWPGGSCSVLCIKTFIIFTANVWSLESRIG
jgi:hypothetical protein